MAPGSKNLIKMCKNALVAEFKIPAMILMQFLFLHKMLESLDDTSDPLFSGSLGLSV